MLKCSTLANSHLVLWLLNDDVQFFCFRLKIHLLRKFVARIPNCLFKLKFGTLTKLIFPLSVLEQCIRPEIPFLGNFVPKNQNCLFTLKFGTQTNSNVSSLMVVLFFQFSDQKYFWTGNLVQKFKIVLKFYFIFVLIRTNLLQRFCRICEIRLRCFPIQFKVKSDTSINSNMSNSII